MSSEGIPVLDSMTETLTPHDAARVLAQASRYEGALVQRTEGLTAMIWGLVGPAIFLTYSFAERTPGFPEWGNALLWIPWVSAGALVTFALWRSAAISMPNVQDPISPLGYLMRFGVFTLLLIVAFALWQPHHYAGPLLLVGAFYVAMGALNPYAMSRTGRLVVGVVGAVLLAAASAAFAMPKSDTGFILTILTAGLAPLGGGLYQTLRG